jgi:enoyl-CoA hydratase/carnithine racemase
MPIDYEVSDGIAEVRINRPEKLNSLTLDMYRELGDAFLEARDDDRVEVLVLTGAGERSFCVGADLTESIPALSEDRFDISEWDDAHLKHLGLYKPVISAINGLCLGGGFEIMLATDIRVASSSAEFGLPEPGLGIVPAGGTLVRLVRQISHAHAMELLLTGERVSATEALRMGLVNRVVAREELMPTAMKFAERIASISPTAVQNIKETVTGLRDLPLEEAFSEEARLGQRAFTSLDAKEGLKAFIERRSPDFPSHRNRDKHA